MSSFYPVKLTDEVIWQQNAFSRDAYFEVDEGQDDLGEAEALESLIEQIARDVVTAAAENW